MITVHSFESLGRGDFGWLKARYHFSFASYYNPERMGFGVLRVINDDRISAGHGFPPHPHREMEIITYVREGAITHGDDKGNGGRTSAGNIQVMSAGTGIVHSEYNHESVETVIYQMWIEPNRSKVPPRWESREFPTSLVGDELIPLASGRPHDIERGALMIYQDATISGGRLAAGSQARCPLMYQGYVLISRGEVTIDGRRLVAGDGAEITGEPMVTIQTVTESEVIVIDVPVR